VTTWSFTGANTDPGSFDGFFTAAARNVADHAVVSCGRVGELRRGAVADGERDGLTMRPHSTGVLELRNRGSRP